MPVPKDSFFLFGPRGTGKSFWLKTYFKADLTIDLLNSKTFLELSSQPELLRKMVEALDKKSRVVIDEIQRLPGLLNEVHSLIFDYGTKYQFALTGSSARKMKSQKANWLAGRAVNRHFFTLTRNEIGEKFNLDDTLMYGALPQVKNLSASEDKVDYLNAYVENYLTEEIQREALIRNLSSYHRFLKHAALMNGQVINLSNISREASVNRQTLQGYFEILQDTLIGQLLEPIELAAKVKEVSKPKFYFFDCGVVNSLTNNLKSFPEFNKGLLFETFIFNELRAFSNYHRKNWQFYYWGTPSKNEVDFVILDGKTKIAIEVKASNKWRNEYNQGLSLLLTERKVSKAYGVYLGDKNLAYEKIKVLTLNNFLKELENI